MKNFSIALLIFFIAIQVSAQTILKTETAKLSVQEEEIINKQYLKYEVVHIDPSVLRKCLGIVKNGDRTIFAVTKH